jgi:hypothetical protein
MSKLLAAANVQQHFVAPFSHQSNGQVENLNRRVEHVLRVMILGARQAMRRHTYNHFLRHEWPIVSPRIQPSARFLYEHCPGIPTGARQAECRACQCAHMAQTLPHVGRQLHFDGAEARVLNYSD